MKLTCTYSFSYYRHQQGSNGLCIRANGSSNTKISIKLRTLKNMCSVFRISRTLLRYIQTSNYIWQEIRSETNLSNTLRSSTYPRKWEDLGQIAQTKDQTNLHVTYTAFLQVDRSPPSSVNPLLFRCPPEFLPPLRFARSALLHIHIHWYFTNTTNSNLDLQQRENIQVAEQLHIALRWPMLMWAILQVNHTSATNS